MIIDTSIIIHIILRENHWKYSLLWLSQQTTLAVSATSLLEAHAVVQNRYSFDTAKIDILLDKLDIEVISFNEVQSIFARRAYSIYGKGQKHKAKLNFGDCLVYGLAKSRNEVLAFVGNDFNHTDLELVQFPIPIQRELF